MKVHRITHSLGIPAVLTRDATFDQTPVKQPGRGRKVPRAAFRDKNGPVDGHEVAKKGQKWNREFPPSYWTSYFK